MKRLLFSWVLACCFFMVAMQVDARQVEFPCLDKSAMREDAECLLRLLMEANPQLSLRKRLTGIDHIADARQFFENSIDTISCFGGFYYTLAHMVGCMRDTHCRLQGPHAYVAEPFPQDVIDLNRAYSSTYPNYSYPLFANLILRDGKLYLTDTITLFMTSQREEGETLVLFSGASIDSMGGEPILSDRIQGVNLYSRHRWDPVSGRYYSSCLGMPEYYNLPNDWIAITQPDGERIRYRVGATHGGTLSGTSYVDFFDYSVQYAEDLELLYIRIPAMRDSVAQSIIYPELAKYRDRRIGKVVIDVRGNSGGSDLVWLDLMSRLLPTRLQMRVEAVTTVANLTRYMPRAAAMHPRIERSQHPLLRDEVNICRYPFMIDTIGHSPMSLNLCAPIYLLVDEYSYSSTLAFMAAAKQIPGMVSIGQRSGYYGGRGVDPLCFFLPHSKVAFRVEPIMELTGAETAEDVLQDRPTIEYPISVEEINRHKTYRGKRFALDYMREHDSLVRYVVGL